TIVLEAVVRAFGFARGAVLMARDVDLRLVAATGPVSSSELRFGRDELMDAAWRTRQAQLCSSLDAETDPRLSELFPDARNVVVVPLTIGEGSRLGVLALEGARGRSGLRRWEIAMLGQYASHSALALFNAQLTEER